MTSREQELEKEVAELKQIIERLKEEIQRLKWAATTHD